MTRVHEETRTGRRLQILVALMGLPIVVSALGMCGLETYRWLRPAAPLFAAPGGSLAAAILDDDVRGAYGLIRAGQDPAAPIAVRHLELTGDRQIEVPPLVWAVATESDWAVSMLLLGFGVRPDPATYQRALCLAEQLDRPDIVQLLHLAGATAAVAPCPARENEDAPLLVN